MPYIEYEIICVSDKKDILFDKKRIGKFHKLEINFFRIMYPTLGKGYRN